MDKKFKLLTIVVPVYKVERYINKCLDSCILQSQEMMDLLEVIIVNDGTPDRSAELSREYTLRYPQTFRQIDKENGGHGSAWNVGLKEARGKYLRFLDSDDWLTHLDEFMGLLTNVEADIVLTDYVRVDEKSKQTTLFSVNLTDGCHSLTNGLINSLPMGGFTLNFWYATYRTAILQPQYPLFAEHVMYDDSILEVAPLLYGRTVAYCPLALYNYLVGRTGQSMSVSVVSRNVSSYIQCYEHMVEWTRNADSSNMPQDLKVCAHRSVVLYAHRVYDSLPYLPYRESKRMMSLFYQRGFYASNGGKSKMVGRYERLPFFVFYGVERLRRLINRLR